MRVTAAVLAAGRGERFGGDKTSALLGGKAVWRWSFDSLVSHPRIDEVGLVVAPGAAHLYHAPEAAFVVEGGASRQESSRIAAEASQGDIVLIHDAARPFVFPEVVDRVVEAVGRSDAAAPAIAVADTLRHLGSAGYELIDRSKTVAMQTPQGARREVLLAAHSSADRTYTDEIALIEALGASYEIVEGDSRSFKITTQEDMDRAQSMAAGGETRTGFGYDIHPFSTDESRPLMLGGVRFEGAGLDGHSDADVVIHAVVDALLGAAGLGDIGQHFPNTDPRWRNASSLTFLSHARQELATRGWSIVNVDITLIGEKPKVMPRAWEIRQVLAEALAVESDRVNLKATTNEGLGSLGRAEGIAVHAVSTIRRRG
ncbi:MAG TPA: 2-C-methyl-D-erythritol 2,4-cyclodiphosphate synthase [Fimbriimonadaceae bacterium]|nr:2-C-methyl-D-erythritol 2,4-cyclodiphosphate synthase [Fimbriimonadaceae bacterium]